MSRKVISKLCMQELYNRRELVCKDKGGKYRPVFKKQGSMDGACATYSLIMNLLILGCIYESDTHLHAEHKNADTKRLFKVFCEDYGMHRDGKTFYKMKRLIEASYSNVVSVDHKLTSNQTAVSLIKDTIDEDMPIIISVYNARFCHAMLAIGYEIENDDVKRILCLDPDGDYIHGNKRWNSTIDILSETKYRYTSTFEGILSEQNVQLDDVLIITKK